MKKVIIYSTPTCGYCHMAKDFFKEHNIDYTDYDVAADDAKRQEMIDRSGQMGVPVIDIDGELTIGFDEQKISKLLGIK
ncbi:MAG: NrdH-redoxin [Candidatus Niyogibacteria bacterium]|nr:NrdH-redoxin [Candidatus Niyogibacteria bacterium]